MGEGWGYEFDRGVELADVVDKVHKFQMGGF